MGFVWATNVGVGANIDAADRNETKDHVSELYTTLGKNWPGNVRFPNCVGAGYDMAGPCQVVWPIAIGDDIYQTPGAHPVSELREARDKLDWIKDNKCATDNTGFDNAENVAANPTTLGAANPVTRAVAYPITQAVANPITQAGENPITNASFEPGCGSDCPGEDAAANAITQAAENPVTNVSHEPGCDSDCPLEDGAANAITQAAENPITQSVAYPITQSAENPITRSAANPVTRSAANPVTRSAANPVTRSAAYPITQSAENPVTNTSNDPGCGADCPLEDGAANAITQSAENPITHVSNEPGCLADCPLENSPANPYTNTGEDTIAYNDNYQDLTTNKGIDESTNQSGDEYQDYGTVRHAERTAEHRPDNVGFDLFVNITVNAVNLAPNYGIDNVHHCSSEFGAVYTHVQYDDRFT